MKPAAKAVEKANAASGKHLTLAKDAAPIRGGFILRDRNVEVNCAFETLVRLRDPAQKIIFPCTNSGYGLGQGQQYCTEASPINPISLYGKTKMAAEKAVLTVPTEVMTCYLKIDYSLTSKAEHLLQSVVHKTSLTDLLAYARTQKFTHAQCAVIVLLVMQHFDIESTEKPIVRVEKSGQLLVDTEFYGDDVWLEPMESF